MGISSSMWVGASGLTAEGEAIKITGDNIANVNTIGFKDSRASFEDVIGQTMQGSTSNVGLGVRIGAVDQNFSQGSIENTGINTDMAIDGDGYFVVKGTNKGVTGNFFTRDGQFHMDKQGYMVTSGGLRLQAYGVDSRGQLTSQVGDLRMSDQAVPAQPSANITMNANLDSGSAIKTFDPTDPYGTSNFSTSMEVYDSLGNARKMDVFFSNQGGNNWTWTAMTDGANVAGGTPGTPSQIATGTLGFTTSGALDTVTGNSATVDFLGATPGQALNFDFGDALSAGGTGLAGSTQYAAPSSMSKQEQDGFAAGSIRGFSISDDGTVTGTFSNGQQRTVGQVVLADFPSDDGLSRIGSSLFQQTTKSGEATIGAANTGARGRLVSGGLEQSTVDLGQQFVDLIAYQRGFQANSKIITTADEMLQDVMQLKR